MTTKPPTTPGYYWAHAIPFDGDQEQPEDWEVIRLESPGGRWERFGIPVDYSSGQIGRLFDKFHGPLDRPTSHHLEAAS